MAFKNGIGTYDQVELEKVIDNNDPRNSPGYEYEVWRSKEMILDFIPEICGLENNNSDSITSRIGYLEKTIAMGFVFMRLHWYGETEDRLAGIDERCSAGWRKVWQ